MYSGPKRRSSAFTVLSRSYWAVFSPVAVSTLFVHQPGIQHAQLIASAPKAMAVYAWKRRRLRVVGSKFRALCEFTCGMYQKLRPVRRQASATMLKLSYI